MKILLQPCANPDAQRHFEDTIRSPVSLDRLARHLSADELNRLRPHARNDGIITWGLTPATDDSSVGMWERLSSGDLVAFFADREVFFVGRVCEKVRNRQLALALWDTQPDGQTWELVYFLDPGPPTPTFLLQTSQVRLVTRVTSSLAHDSVLRMGTIYDSAQSETENRGIGWCVRTIS